MTSKQREKELSKLRQPGAMLPRWFEDECEHCGVRHHLTRTQERERKALELCGECEVQLQLEEEHDAQLEEIYNRAYTVLTDCGVLPTIASQLANYIIKGGREPT